MNQKIKQNKAITLIALVITIVVIVILGGISIYLVIGENGIINKSKESVQMQNISAAKEKLELLKGEVQLNKDYGYRVNLENYLTELDKVKDKYNVEIIRIENDDINAELIVDGKYKFLITDTQNGDVEIISQEESGIILSQTRGLILYPGTLTFEILKNESGGELSVESENINIATASIEGTTVTVEAQGISGVTKIIVRSEANAGIEEGKAIYVVTVQNGEITLDATPYTGTYDGNAHDAITNVIVTPEDATIQYALNGGEYSEEIPKVTNASSYTISIKASKIGYTTKEITKTVMIEEATTATASGVDKIYTGSSQTGVTGNNVDWSGTTSATNAGTYTAYATPKENYAWSDGTTTKKTITWKITQKTGELTLSALSGTITYPTVATFTVDKNTSGGTLSVKSSNEQIATASISGTTVTITPKGITSDGQKVTITVTSSATSNYKAQTATYTATVNRGEIGINATGYSGTYDGKAHSAITINNVVPADAKLEYAIGNGEYSSTLPTVTEAGTYSVSIRASKEGYITNVITKIATVEKLATATASGSDKTYTGSTQTGVTGSNVDWSGTTSAAEPGTYTAYATPKANYAWSDGTTTKKTITWKIIQLTGELTLSEITGTIIYPNTKTFTISKNTSGGALSVSSSNTSVATASISGTTVTITPKAITSDGQKATITVTSAATGSYVAQTTTYTVTVNRGEIGINATAYSGTYDGNAHNAVTINNVVPADAKLEYALGNGAYSTTVPTVTEAGTYSVSIRATKEGYITNVVTRVATVEKLATATASGADKSYTGLTQTGVTGSNVDWSGTTSAAEPGTYTAYATPKANYAWSDGTTTKKTITWKIIQLTGELTLSATSGTITYPDTKTFTVSKNTSGGELSVSSSNTSVATASISGTTVTITPKAITADGQKAEITVTSAAIGSYAAQTVKYTVTVNRGEIGINATAYSGTYDGNAHNAVTINNVVPASAKLEYALGNGAYSTTMPTVTETGTYTVSIKATKEGYVTKEITKTATVTGIPVAKVGTTNYPSITKAIEAISSSGTIVMLDNSTENLTIPEGKTITLNTDSYTLTGKVTNNGTLNVSGGGKITGATPVVTNAGTFTVTNVTITQGGASGSHSIVNTGNLTVNSGTISASAGSVDNSGSATIKGGSFSAAGPALRNNSEGQVDISGGTFSSPVTNEGQIDISGGTFKVYLQNSGIANITGGTFESSTYTLNNQSGGTLTVSDGTFTTTSTSTTGYGCLKNYGTATLKGGTYTSNKSECLYNYEGGTLNIEKPATFYSAGESGLRNYGTTNFNGAGASGVPFKMSGDAYYNIDNYGSLNVNDTYILGLSVTNEGIMNRQGATIYIASGAWVGSNGVFISENDYCTYAIYNQGKVTNMGTVSGKYYAYYNSGSSASFGGPASSTVSGNHN